MNGLAAIALGGAAWPIPRKGLGGSLEAGA